MKLAFGKILSHHKYDLTLERQRSAAEEYILPYCKPNDKHPRKKILEIGPGDGYLKYFCDGSNLDFYGIDKDPKKRDICERIGYQMACFDVERHILPYEKDFFDVIVAGNVLNYLNDPATVIEEILRVLKNDGLVIISLPIYFWPLSILLKMTSPLLLTNAAPRNFYTYSSLQRLFKNLHLVDIRGYRVLPNFLKLEDIEMFYRFSTWMGKTFPSLAFEVNIILKKDSNHKES
jgi:SAM-dependent methyltransferase